MVRRVIQKATMPIAFLFSLFVVLSGYEAIQSKGEERSFNIRSVELDENTYPVIILGSGAGGLTAALYCTTANIPCLVVRGETPGGALTQSDSVRNWPGHIDISGTDLMQTMLDQVKSHKVPMVAEVAMSVDFSSWPYKIVTQPVFGAGEKKTYKALSCIIAMGSIPNYLGIPGEQEFLGQGVSTCATCDGSLYYDKDVVVIGGGDSAMVEAAYLSGIARSVHVFVRSKKLRARDKRRDYVLSRSNVTVHYNAEVKEIKGDGDGVTGIMVHDKDKNELYHMVVDGVFLAIGSRPNSSIFKKQLDLDLHDYILVDHYRETSHPGVYAVGDIADYEFMQLVTAASGGCIASLRALDFLHYAGYTPPQKTIDVKNKPEEQKPVQVSGSLRQEETEKTSGELISITSKEHFNRIVLGSSLPVVVDFYATWCGPCKRMLPVVEQAAKDLEGSVRFVKVNVDDVRSLAQEYSIRSIPTFLFVKNGKVVKTHLGGQDAERFQADIKRIFGLK